MRVFYLNYEGDNSKMSLRHDFFTSPINYWYFIPSEMAYKAGTEMIKTFSI